MRKPWEIPTTIAVLALVALGGLWWRGPQPELREPTAEQTAEAGSLIDAVAEYLTGRSDGAQTVELPGRWYVTVYPRAGGDGVTVEASGPVARFAEPLRAGWPGWLQVDRALPDPPGLRAGPRGFGLEVGLDGWLERSGRVHLPVTALLAGLDRPSLAKLYGTEPGEPLRTNSWVGTAAGPRWMVRHSVDPGAIEPGLLRQRITLAADYLTRHLARDGRFDYEWDARAGRARPGYNLVRHAGTAYSMLQAAAVTGDSRHERAAARAIETLEADRRADSRFPERCFVVEEGRVKLGAAALTLMALVEQARRRPEAAQHEWMHCLGEHIVAQTDAEGDMASYHADGGRYELPERRSAYYPGEAVLALTRLYRIDRDPRWLETAVRAADFLVKRRYVALGTRIGVPPDAWLAQGLAELDLLAPDAERRAYAFAIGRLLVREQLVSDLAPPDLWGAPDAVTWPSVIQAGARGEALWAVAELERRHRPRERFFLERLMALARFTLRNQYSWDLLFGLADPRAALGGFRSSPADPVIRIDGVQHNLSALIGLLALLEEGR